MANTLPKHIESMVQKNNLVAAIKTLSSENKISMDDAKSMIDEYEEKLKQKRLSEQEKISKKQKPKNKKEAKQLIQQKSLIPYFLKLFLIFVMGSITITIIKVYVS